MYSLRRLAVLTLVWLACASAAAAHGVLHGFVDEAVTSGLSLPVAFTTLPDGRVLIAEKAGVVRIVSGGHLLPDAFIDLRARVNDYWDRGLLGLAADPAFAQNGFVYLFYVHEDDPFTYSGPKTSRLVRVTAMGDEADPATEVVLIGGIPADSPSHNGGALRFGPDGALWISTGDASSFNAVDTRALRTQQLDSLAGKLLRVGTDGRGLAGNPFWNGDADAVRSKVYAYGFRNPFRLTFRPGTGRPYVADVGANDWEEVNAVVRGGNHGWPCVEGPLPQAGYQALAECQALYAQGAGAVALPLVTYPHVPGTASVTGGAFYTGTAFPDLYRGAYFFGDFSRGTCTTWRSTADVAGPTRASAPTSTAWWTCRRMRPAFDFPLERCAACATCPTPDCDRHCIFGRDVDGGDGHERQWSDRARLSHGDRCGRRRSLTLGGESHAKGLGVPPRRTSAWPWAACARRSPPPWVWTRPPAAAAA
jgi:glucose/arabinose dehydrogenase